MAVTARTDIKPHPSQPTALFTPVFILGWLVNLTQYLSFYFLITVMALYAMESFAVSETAGGFAASSFVIGATVARVFADGQPTVLVRSRSCSSLSAWER